jgi:pyruvate, water dikinase
LRSLVHGKTLVGGTRPAVTGRAATADEFQPGDVLICPALSLDHYQQAMDSAAVLCSAGGLTGHLPSICRIRGIPVVIFDRADLGAITVGASVTVDPATGSATVDGTGWDSRRTGHVIVRPDLSGLEPIEAVIAVRADMHAVNISKAANLVDSFFIREEFLWTAIAADQTHSARIASPADGALLLRSEAEAMLSSLAHGQGLTFRLLDLRSDEAAVLELEVAGPVSEPNPELGLHGSRRIVQDARYQEMIRILTSQLRADAITWSIPFINDEFELRQILDKLDVTNAHGWGVFVETPAAVCQLPRMLDTGVSVVNVGTKDLVQFVLAADRNSNAVAHVYDTRHPAVMSALSAVVNHCAGYDVTLRIFALGKDLDYYRSWLPPETRFMLCTGELIQLISPA